MTPTPSTRSKYKPKLNFQPEFYISSIVQSPKLNTYIVKETEFQ